MSRTLELQLLLRLNDQMSARLNAILRDTVRESGQAQRGLAHLNSGINGLNPAPINRITRALQQLTATGRGSVALMSRLSQSSISVAAGGYAAKKMLDKPLSYDRQLALKANTAYQERDVGGRILGKQELDASIRAAVKYAGGTPEIALEGLNSLIGSGAMGDGKAGIKNSLAVLPALLRAYTGTGADVGDLAQIMTSAKQTMGLSDKELPLVLSKAIRAGQLGGFELPDMARWLPQQMALAAGNGMHGMAGIEALLAANQVSRITAGTADAAGNNLVNLLAKLNSQDTRNDLAKIDKNTGQKLSGKQAKAGRGIDLTGELVKAREQGVNPLEAFVNIVNKVGQSDKAYQHLQQKIAAQSESERKVTLLEMADLLIGKSIGLAVQDRQALGALLAMIQNAEKYQSTKSGIAAERGNELSTSFGVVAATADAKAEQVANRTAFAAMDALKAIEEPLGNMLDGVVDVADASPTLARNLYFAATAAGVFAASAGAASLLNRTASGAAGAGLGGLIGGAGGSRLLNQARGTAGLAGGLSITELLAAGGLGAGALTVGGLALAGGAGYGIGKGLNWASDGRIQEAADGIMQRIGDNFLNVKQEPVKVVVDVKNGNIVASVNEANARQGSRH